MKKFVRAREEFTAVALFVLAIFGAKAAFVPRAGAQGDELKQRVAELKQAMAQNKQKLAQYTWEEFVTVSLKGEQKKQETFLVRLGPDGKPVKTPVNQPSSDSSNGGGRRGGRVREHVVEKKKEEYAEYADRMKTLMEQYVPPDKDLLQKAIENKNISLKAGAPGQVQIVINGYYKPKDTMTIVFDQEQKQLLSIQIASYLDDPSDAVNLTVRMSRLPDGVSHVDSAVLDGVSKQLKVAIQNSNYQHF
jgi:GGDEF domain-containing protein